MSIFYVHGSYLNAGMLEEKFILLKIEVEFVYIMRKVNPEHNKDVRLENGVKLIYLRLLKALYVCIEPSLLRYNLYSKTMKSHEFAVNPYDSCIENSTINGNQYTI